MLTRTTNRSLIVALTFTAVLAAPLLAADRDGGKRTPGQREPNVITRLAEKIRHILGDFPIVPHPDAPPTTSK
jgi:hypothetical protein